MAEPTVTLKEGAGLLLQQLAGAPAAEHALLVEQALLGAKQVGVRECVIMLGIMQTSLVRRDWSIGTAHEKLCELLASYLADESELKCQLVTLRARAG